MMSSHEPERVDGKFYRGLFTAFLVLYGTVALLAWVML